MPKYQITSPDGQKFEVNAPEGATQEQVLAYAQSQFSQQPPKQETSALKNLGLGALRGVGGIGASLAQPFQALAGGALGDNVQMRQNMEDNLSRFGADKDSLSYQGGKLGAEIAGTYGVGGLAGRGLAAVSQSPKALALADALATGGMSKGVPLLTNMAGGAGSAALGTLLVDPENTGTGAAVGAAIPAVGAAVPAVGNMLANAIGGVGTHTGGDSIRTAAQSGMRGGESGAAFIDNLRGRVPMTDVLDKAKAGLSQIGADRAKAYREGMKGVTADKSILAFDGIDDAINSALNKVSYGGQVTNQKGAEVAQELANAVKNWKGLPPEQFHTAEGLDALKRSVSGTVEAIPFEQNTARAVGGDVYNAIKREISNQAPDYANTMKEYSEASELMGEIQKALLTKNGSTDSAMRKLQSVMRNNVNTNYGNRLDLARALEERGGHEIMPSLAGQALNSWTPRGLGSVGMGAATSLPVGASYLTSSALPLAGLLLQSPRIVGEGAYLTGKAARGVKGAADKISPATAALINALNGD
jgi:hypothetical protein